MDTAAPKKQPKFSKQTALKNLQKAWNRNKANKAKSQSLSLESYREQGQADTLEVVAALGHHIKNLTGRGTDKLLKNAYGYKSLCDTYSSLTAKLYPFGFQKQQESALKQIVGSVAADVTKMLTVNVNISSTNPTPQHLDISVDKPKAKPCVINETIGENKQITQLDQQVMEKERT